MIKLKFSFPNAPRLFETSINQIYANYESDAEEDWDQYQDDYISSSSLLYLPVQGISGIQLHRTQEVHESKVFYGST